jgi:hypothetical protein
MTKNDKGRNRLASGAAPKTTADTRNSVTLAAIALNVAFFWVMLDDAIGEVS